MFRKLGVDNTSELRLRGRGDADGDDAADLLADATGVFFSGGDQSRLRTLVGSRTNDILSDRLAGDGLVVGRHERRRHRDGPHHDPRRRRGGRLGGRRPDRARPRAGARRR